MGRNEEMLGLIPEDEKKILEKVMDQVLFLEKRLDELKELPFLQVDPKNPMRQRSTPAAKMYKEFLQQYTNCIKVIEAAVYREKRNENEDGEESPLRRWFNEHMKDADTG